MMITSPVSNLPKEISLLLEGVVVVRLCDIGPRRLTFLVVVEG